MSDGRKRLSEYQYKKIAKEKRKKKDELLEKTKALHTFFRPITYQGNENNIDKPILENYVQPNFSSTTESEISSISSQGSSITSEQSQKQDIALSKLTAEDASDLGLSSVSDDPAEWRINNNLIDHLFSKEINQNLHADFSLSKARFGKQDRFLSKSAFYR